MDERTDKDGSSNAGTTSERKPQTKRAAFRLESWFLEELIERAHLERVGLVEHFREQSDSSAADQEPKTKDRFAEKSIPSLEHLNEIVQASFWASLRKEEGKFAKFAVAYEEKDNDPWTIALKETKSFDVEHLAKLAPAIGNLTSAIKVYPNADGVLEIWGVSNYYSTPLKVKILDPGQIIVSYLHDTPPQPAP